MNYPQQSYQVMDFQATAPGGGNQPPDLIAMLWRWKWLPVLGALLGATIGLLVWVRTPPQFMAMARIQILTPGSRNLPIVDLDPGDAQMMSRSDDVAIMTSRNILLYAIEAGRLNQHVKLSEMNTDELVEWIRDKDRLTVRPGTKEAVTNIIEILFRCEDGELAAEVVNSIVLGYEKFIRGEATNMSLDVLAKLAKFRDEYDTRAKDIRQEYLQIRFESPLLGTGNEIKDPYTEALLRDNEALSISRAKLSRVHATLQQIEKQKDKVSPDSLLMTVRRLANDPSLAAAGNVLQDLISKESILRSDLSSEKFKTERLQPIEASLAYFRSMYADNHPSVAPVIKQYESLQKTYAEIRAAEELDLAAKQKTLDEANIDPMSAEEKLQLFIISLEQEAQILEAEQQNLLASARENERNSKEMNTALARLEVCRNEMELITKNSEELRNALERLNMGTGATGKVMKRLETQSVGGQDGPYLWKYAALSAFLGACLFSGLAYLLELADRSYRGPDEIARDLGVPILGHLQMTSLTRKDRKDESMDLSLVAFHKSKSTASEAFRGVRTAIYFGNQAGNIKVIQVTSPVPGDGKSTVAANLSISISQSGRRTLLLDCDMRRPRQAKLMGVRDDIGLTNVLAGKITIDEAVQPTVVPNLDILTCGRRPGNPAELLLSDDFVDLINSLRQKYDYIIMDTPPLLAVSDPANASACADGVIMTLRLRRNLRPLAVRAAQMLQSVNANLLGVAINGVTGRGGYGYGGYRYDGSRASYGYGGYGGYGYGATYGYGDYYTSSTAEAITGRVIKTADGTPQATGNGQHVASNGSVAKNSEKPKST